MKITNNLLIAALLLLLPVTLFADIGKTTSQASATITLTIHEYFQTKPIPDITLSTSQSSPLKTQLCITSSGKSQYAVSFSGDGPNQQFLAKNRHHASHFKVKYHHKDKVYQAIVGKPIRHLSITNQCQKIGGDAISITMEDKPESALTGSLTMLLIPQ